MDKRLNQFLAAENLTQAEFAKRLGVARAGISHILQGRNSPSYAFILSMMQNFPALNIEWLLSGKGKMYRENREFPQESVSKTGFSNDSDQRADISDVLFPIEDDQVSEYKQVEDRRSVPAEDGRQPMSPARSEKFPEIIKTEKQNTQVQSEPIIRNSSKEIKKIVVFFSDNTFEEFKGI